jgi:GT2 family glycosyltransferase
MLVKDKKISSEVISIIIVNYKSEKPLLSCLKKLHKGSELKNFRIIIINNGTGDAELLSKISNFSKVTVIDSNQNLGFAAGVNKGIQATDGGSVLLLNPDTLVNKGSLKKLVRCMCTTGAGIVGGLNYKFNQERHNTHVRRPDIFTYIFDYTNLRKLIPGDYFHRKHYYLNEPLPSKVKLVDAVSGSFMLISRDVIDSIGLFDEGFFMYLEDIDYCLRAIDNGFKVLFCPKSSIKHVGGYSSPNKERVSIESWLNSRKYYVQKYGNLFTNFIVQPIFMIDTGVIRLLRALK